MSEISTVVGRDYFENKLPVFKNASLNSQIPYWYPRIPPGL